MNHRRPRQIKRAYMMMKNPMVLFGIDIGLPDGTFEFVEAKDLAEWQEKYVMKCGTCKHFVGGGDWNLCCDLPHENYPCGFLCYEDTAACKDYEEGKYEWHYDGSRFT